jgi:hypothetical protein
VKSRRNKKETVMERKRNGIKRATVTVVGLALISWAAIKARDSVWDARIKSAINAQLAANGWTQVDNGAGNTQGSKVGTTLMGSVPVRRPRTNS